MEVSTRKVVPKLLEYNGVPVLTNRQLTKLYYCSRQVVDGAFRRHKEKFIEGVDYFYLEGEKLRDFKVSNFSCSPAGNFSCSPDDDAPFSNIASTLYLWTKSGALKLSEFIGTDNAKTIYAGLAMTYFKPIEPKQIQLFEPKEIENNFGKSENCCKVLDKFIAFLDKCAAITNEKLREEIIKKAVALI